jgi:ankyrin repeat protein
VERLIEAGANISNYDFAGCTPLSAAAAGDHLACAQLLLSHGASTHLVEHDSVSLVSPMIEAIRCGSKKMLRLLLEEGMDLNAKTQRKNPLIVALQEGDVEIVEMLVKRGADVDGDEEARRTIGWPAYVFISSL